MHTESQREAVLLLWLMEVEKRRMREVVVAGLQTA
jgi:hypothetical protein